MVAVEEKEIVEAVLGDTPDSDPTNQAKRYKAVGRAFKGLFGRKRKRHQNYPPRPHPFRQPGTPVSDPEA